MAKPSLKRATIEGIQTEGAFAMDKWGQENVLTKKVNKRTSKKNPTCGTACCIAGHVVAAARRMGMPVLTPKKIALAWQLYYAELDGKTLTKKQEELVSRVQKWNEDGSTIAVIARDAWAQAYGKKDAARLDFYGQTLEDNEDSPSQDLEYVTPESAVNHIRHNTPLEAVEPAEDPEENI